MGAGSSMSAVNHPGMEFHPDKDTWDIEEANAHRHKMEEIVRNESARLTVSELLYEAAYTGNVEQCNEYIDNGANLEYASVQGGMTPLHIAAMNDHVDCVKLLIDRGAYAMSKDHSNKSPGNYAEANGNYELAKIIRQLWLERPSPKGLKPMMSMGPDWQPELRNVKQYAITVSRPKFVTIDNRTSGVFHEAANRGFASYHNPKNETNHGFRASISMSTYGREGKGMQKSNQVIHTE
jgi:ankyrin repeat protein